MSAGEVAALLAALGVVVLVAFAVPALVQLRRLLGRLERAVDRLEGALDPVLAETRTALSEARRAISEVTALTEEASRSVRSIRLAVLQLANAPVASAVGVVEGVREALGALFRKDRKKP